MYRQYFKQAWQMLKENKFYSFIYIVGTAFTITMVMLILTTYHIKTANFAPETHRDRTLFVSRARIEPKDKNQEWYSSAQASLRVVKECYYSLTTPELVTAVIPFYSVTLNIPGSDEFIMCDRLATDAKFWQLFSFKFIEGKPYDEADFESGLRKVVVSQQMAHKLYGTSNVLGETIEVNREPFSICGVVKDIPTIAENAYADIWLPYTTSREAEYNFDGENILGPLHVYILAHSKDDFDDIRQEIENKVSILNSAHSNTNYIISGQPDDLLSKYLRQKEVVFVNISAEIRKYALVIFFLLFIPILNISGLIISRMKKREAELGLRKAFGATSKTLVIQILTENFLPVLIGGLIGLILSSLTIRLLSSFFLASAYSGGFVSSISTPDLILLINPVTFLYVFILCIALNIGSALLPALRTSNTPIINALNNK